VITINAGEICNFAYLNIGGELVYFKELFTKNVKFMYWYEKMVRITLRDL
jgi:hypothetical protein